MWGADLKHLIPRSSTHNTSLLVLSLHAVNVYSVDMWSALAQCATMENMNMHFRLRSATNYQV